MASSTTTDPSPDEQRQSFPNYLSTVNVANFVSSKLSGDKNSSNYFQWKQQILCLIESQDLLRFIDGTIPPPQPPPKVPSDDDGSYINNVVWRTDRVVKGWILGALADNVLKNVANFTTARDVWFELEKIFTSTGAVTAPPQTQVVEDEWRDYLPLYRATLMGDWDAAKRIIDNDPNAIKARIAFTLETSLHIAVGTGKSIHFVQNLVDIMPDDLIGVKDELGYNALHVAALTGNTEAAKILIGRRADLLCVPDNTGSFPVHLAALSAHRETLWCLISKTSDDCFPSPYLDQTGLKLLCIVIDADIFDVALYLASKYSHLATLRLGDGTSALQRIALKDSAFSSGERSFNFWERFIYSVPRAKKTHRRKQIYQQALELVKCLCKNMESLDYRMVSGIYVDVMLTAARLGIHEVIEELVATFPAAIYSRNFYSKQYIFHVAVENRSEKVFNLLYQTSNLKHQYSDLVDNSGNTLLHLAGRLAPSHKLNLISGAALQMQRELQWFQEVEKFLHPYSRERSNKAGKTPRMVFTEEHMQLKADGEKWMKDTATSCTIAAALIATVVFAAAITVPGGNQSDSGFPLLYTHASFILFAVSDAISLFTSTTSLLMFLSILTSRYAEQDFLYALPKRLCIGLVTLFMSICFMMVAFSATVFLEFGKAEKKWILIPVAVLACLPVTSFVLLQFPLLVDVISNTYGRGIFGKQSNRPFY
ncbi:ankyrin repeat ph and sec7 domain containing protein secg [Phtheirospermum japonicum]|uniref:Ankyrin repeat ph and sec7 domain containing protein secg n=1 Tax=Phtheirospermum japonicum TaxID=374723 RepID=A0A830BY14_9LAMI|nr:ankyrin repeat ph and sec7 domain containing protein secg [Phtheirospermum japonicum]